MRPRVTIRDVMRVDPVAGVMGTADDRDEALRLAAESAPSGTSVEQMASAAAEIIRARVAQKAPPPPRVPYFHTFAPIESFEALPPAPEPPAPEPPAPESPAPERPAPEAPAPEPPLGNHASPAEPDPVEASPEPGDDAAPAPAPEPPPAPEAPPAAPARPTKPRK